MSICTASLHLSAPVAARGLRLPIDFFFRSLAEDQQERSIGVILSGMGSDGTLGLRAIKETGGLALRAGSRRRPSSTACRAAPSTPGWPTSWRPAEELPGRIIAYCTATLTPGSDRGRPGRREPQERPWRRSLVLLRAHTGHDFSLYKKSTIYRRIERRMGLHQIDTIAHYVRYLQENPQEVDLLFKELLIGVTSFFRDPAAWERPGRARSLPDAARRPRPSGRRAARLGARLLDRRGGLFAGHRLQGGARARPAGPGTSRCRSSPPTSTGTPSTRPARASIPRNIAADVSPERLRRFFVQEERGYRVRKEIREMVIFAPQNLIMDPPFTKLDILICRNLLIYLAPELQKKLMPLFHYSLNPGGILFLGQRRDHRRLHRPVRAAGRQDAALPAHGVERPRADAGRVSRPSFCRARRPAHLASRRRCPKPRRPTSRRWPTG